MPDLSLERAAGGRVAGVDEAGRGPWAGPVVAAAVVLPAHLPPLLARNIDDSKRLSRGRREALFAAMGDVVEIGVAAASVDEIDRLNILEATLLAMRRAVDRLDPPPALALVDGNRAPALTCPSRAVVRGDRLSLSIAAASIVAKVTRDRLMAELADDCGAYGWHRNAGYGTAEHQAALARLGVTPHHRRSFRPIAKLLNPRDS
jgi:ribonuclease HII